MRAFKTSRERLIVWVTIFVALCLSAFTASRADLRSVPGWYDENAVALAPDWHYRVPITVPAGTPVNSTVRMDVNFASLMTGLGIVGTFDAASPRIVRPGGALATVQEFTDSVAAGATDAVGNATGEIRYILEDAGTAPYYLYFDIIQNGAKSANSQTPINGNFEKGGSGTLTPPGWTTLTPAVGYDAKITPSEIVSVASNPTSVDTPTTRTTDGRPLTGGFAYLLGNRTTNSGGLAANPGATLSRTFTIPASGTPSITVRWRPEGWDAGQFDPIRIDLVNAAGTVLTEIVGPTQADYANRPFAPNTGGAVATNTASGWRQYNGFDCDLLLRHRLTPPMAVTCHGEPWFTATQSLTNWLGQTVSVRVRVSSDGADKTWYHVDDFEWAVVAGTLGAPEGFGVNIAAPVAGGGVFAGAFMPITVQTDALPSAATTPVTAALFDPSGTQIAGPFLLYNDGSHGDPVLGDGQWTNDGSAPAQPAPTVPPNAVPGAGYILRIYGRDASTSAVSSASNGLARTSSGSGALAQPNYWNIDEIVFTVAVPAMTLTKTSDVISDPVAGTSNPKAIPGAVIRYCLKLGNTSTQTATSVVVTDPIPASQSFISNSVFTGTDCTTANTAVSWSFASGTLTITPGTLAANSSQVLVFRVTQQ